ncbi:serine/threonine-protein phosphatase 6 regulatory ankyrin repeat subunit B-like protein [Cinnamomum micranthum f. kanehirae]|uniref:Serine/threonine-protein phosphatase 6 regulatory ankyrin repeat subunit B-like protein n=1 Tax=Cinnamomum micranthum f. kanehirae TaxID=337451 RepID=A0A443NAU0_9MAGN|nr:serine/threonine-protein phosphatase 6 regulatory ankyrin repeat subunit B-like protein [Cinnamomum micranthum f. kanehirae]
MAVTPVHQNQFLALSKFPTTCHPIHSPPPPPPPPPPPTTTSQSDSKTHISHEISPATPPIPPPQSDSETETLSKGLTEQGTKDKLFEKVMLEDWDAVINIYIDEKDIVSTAKITRNKETALHIAISDSKTVVVEVLLDIIDPIKIREMTNDMDENPLHLAASLGQAETCRQLVEKDPELIGARNKDGETPLFQAALHGKERAFYALHPHCTITGKDIKHDIVYCRRTTDGYSILHVAIQGEYFGLAYQIIYWYPELIMFHNEKGLTALHLLAQNPSAFRSGCHLGPFDDFIYRCLIVDLDKVETPFHFKDEPSMYSDFQSAPGNYQTCLDLLNLWKYIFTVIARWARKWEDIKHDIRKIFNKDVEKQLPVRSTGKDKKQEPEEPSQGKKCEHSHIDVKVGDKIKKKGEGSQEEEKDSTEQPQHPSNYNVFFHFVEFVMEFFLFVLGLGYFEVRNIKAKKQKHKLASQILKMLVHNTGFWMYVGSGSVPVTIDSSIGVDSLVTIPLVDASKQPTEGTYVLSFNTSHFSLSCF